MYEKSKERQRSEEKYGDGGGSTAMRCR